MPSSAHFLSPRELGEAIGVSQSTLKRWADRGLLSVSRTAGGHRRIEVREALRFIRDSGLTIVRPDLIGLPEGSGEGAVEPDSRRRFERALQSGDAEAARALVAALFTAGMPLAELFDELFRPALAEIGTLWLDDPAGIVIEHRATDICLQLVGELRGRIPSSAEHGVALGGAPSGDPYLLPSAMVATALSAEGFQAVNLGPGVPIPVLRGAVESERARLVWLSVTHPVRTRSLQGEIQELRDALIDRNGVLIVGGTHHTTLGLSSGPGLATGRSIADVVAIARG